MTRYTGAWSPGEVAAFLDSTTVPIRIGCRTPSGHPWMVSLWFRYDDGIRCATGAGADLVEYLEHDPAVSFEVSTNDPPYRGVRGRGTATIEPDEEKAELRALIERYLGSTDSGFAASLLDPDREEVRIEIDPERVHSWDFSERMADAIDGDARRDE